MLRRPPTAGGTPSAHDVAREMTVTRALSTTEVPVATPLLLVHDDETIKAPYAVVEFVDGTTLRDRGDVSALVLRCSSPASPTFSTPWPAFIG